MISFEAELLESWKAFGRESKRNTPVTGFKDDARAFATGYILDGASRVSLNGVPDGWRVSHLTHQFRLFTSASLPLVTVGTFRDANCLSVAILGWVADSDHPGLSPNDIARQLYAVAEAGDVETLDRRIAWLSGRYIIVVSDDQKSVVYGDPMCTLSLFWHQTSDGAVASSHSALVSRFAGPFESDECRWVMNSEKYVSPGGKYLPGRITAFDGVDQLFSNCKVAFTRDCALHERFFPMDPLAPISREDAFSEFLTELRAQVAFWLSQGERSYIGLTAGSDARTVLASSMDLFQEAETIGMSYHFFNRNPESTGADLFAGNQLALNASLRYQVVDIRPLVAGTRAANLYSSTFPVGARFPTLAGSLCEQLAAGSLFFISIGGEIGTGFYQDRGAASISAELLAKKFTPSSFGSERAVVELFRDYIRFTEFSHDRLMGYDFYDMFYWEHRLSKWAALGYSEYDLSCVPALPLNSRRLISTMLRLDTADRFSKYLYCRLSEEAGLQ